ncbi:MAG: tRNA (cytidine(56)-2'-O)-methyltransferase [Thermoplasmata archaeon]
MATESSGSRPKRQPKRRRPPTVSVLRVGHRPGRDPRLTTHVALVARAFGAHELLLQPPDPELAGRLDAISTRWGGRFRVRGVDDWRAALRQFEGASVHLTMYGQPMARVLQQLRRHPSILLVVGGAKVPADLFRRATFNVAVGSQPHSEVAAVAIMLDRLHGIPAAAAWAGARRTIVPQARGKKVRETARPGGT